MITLDGHLECQLNNIATEKGLSITQLLSEFISDYFSEKELIKRADDSYRDYLQTGESVSLDQFIKENDLDN
jgi:hypothetical protein